ncbi:MAG: hypothetical protein ACLQVJ_07700 [Syntrophobacteraceae bacterium]
MLRDGWRGIRGGLNTGRVFSGSILIGVNTGRGSVIVSNFLSYTIMARAASGRRDSRASLLLRPARKDANQVRLNRPPLQSSRLLGSKNKSLSSALPCSSLNHNSSALPCSSLNHNSSTNSNSRNIKAKLKRKKRKGANNNSKGCNPLYLIPVWTCRSQEDDTF